MFTFMAAMNKNTLRGLFHTTFILPYSVKHLVENITVPEAAQSSDMSWIIDKLTFKMLGLFFFSYS